MKKSFSFVTFSAFLLFSLSSCCGCGHKCINCGGDGVVEVYGSKIACPKCENTDRDWSNPK